LVGSRNRRETPEASRLSKNDGAPPRAPQFSSSVIATPESPNSPKAFIFDGQAGARLLQHCLILALCCWHRLFPCCCFYVFWGYHKHYYQLADMAQFGANASQKYLKFPDQAAGLSLSIG
jgi:hypothetical protein